jgi:hypothetical protein
MTLEAFDKFYKENYYSFIRYKANYFVRYFGKPFSDVTEIESLTVEKVLENLDKIEEFTLKSYFFITMKNIMRNKYLSGHNKFICCTGDIVEELGDNISDEIYEEKILPKKHKIVLKNYERLNQNDKTILNYYIQGKTKRETYSHFKISENKLNRILNSVKFGNKKKIRVCQICGDKHFAKNFCVKHYMENKRINERKEKERNKT